MLSRTDGDGTAATTARWLAAVPYLVLAAIMGGLVRLAARPLNLPDTYLNLRFGREFLSGGWSLWSPGTGTRFATAHWTPTQWSSELLMAWVDQHLGLAGLCWVMGVVVLAFVVLTFRLARLTGGPLPAVLATGVVVLITATVLSPRAQVISYLLTAVFVDAVMRMRVDLRVRWWLVPLMWVWVTAHGMWPVGLSVVAVGALGIALESQSRAIARQLALLLVLMVSASVATPVGIGAYKAVLAVSSRRTMISEWLPTDFTEPANALLAACIAVVVLAAARRREPLPWTETLLLVLGIGWALYSTRGVPMAAIVLAPQLARVLQGWIPRRPAARREGWVLTAMLAVSSALLAGAVSNNPGRPFQPGSWEAASLGALPARTVILNDEALGGYLLWRYPDLTVVADGYFDRYTDAEFLRIGRLAQALPGWIEDVRASGARVALLAKGSPLAYGLVETLHWTVVRSDSDYEFLKAGP